MKWTDDRQNDEGSDSDSEMVPSITGGHWQKYWLLQPLASLFGGKLNKPVECPQRHQFNEETLLMELLAAEHEDEAPDDGALEGSGDEFEL